MINGDNSSETNCEKSVSDKCWILKAHAQKSILWTLDFKPWQNDDSGYMGQSLLIQAWKELFFEYGYNTIPMIRMEQITIFLHIRVLSLKSVG